MSPNPFNDEEILPEATGPCPPPPCKRREQPQSSLARYMSGTVSERVLGSVLGVETATWEELYFNCEAVQRAWTRRGEWGDLIPMPVRKQCVLEVIDSFTRAE